MSTLTDTKIINLLERLSVVAPERCWQHIGALPQPNWDIWAMRADGHVYHVLERFHPIPILYAVLEEAHARGWEWEKGSSAWELGKGLKVFAMIREGEGDILEREVLPRLEALVLALETKGRAM